MGKKLLAGAMGLCLVGTALAQTSLNRTQREEVMMIFQEVGAACGEIIRNQDVGRIDDNTTLMAVACTETDYVGYVLVVDNRGNMSWYSTCEALAEANDNRVRCFS